MKVLCVTHSDRPFLDARCDLNFLENRFPDSRLEKAKNIERYSKYKEAVPYNGSVSLWKIDSHDYSLSYLTRYAPDYKVQFATFHHDHIVICGSDRIELLDTEFNLVKTIQGPYIVGGHTLHFERDDIAWINSSPGNLIMKVDIESDNILEKIEMPSRYGIGADLRDIDIRDCYIPTDLQPTHVNCAFPYKDSVYVTLLIQGAVGVFNKDRKYKEILNGFTGLHSAKIDPYSELLYFTDSPAGIVWFYDLENRRFVRRFKLESRWAHDTECIDKYIYAAGLSDANCLQIFSTYEMKVKKQYPMEPFGKSVMFINCCEVNNAWESVLVEDKKFLTNSMVENKYTHNVLPRIHNKLFWQPLPNIEAKRNPDPLLEDSVYIASNEKLTYEYFYTSEGFILPKGKYALKVKVVCHSGGISVGVIKKDPDTWIVQIPMDKITNAMEEEFIVESPNDQFQVVLTANNPEDEHTIRVSISEIRIEPLTTIPQAEIEAEFKKFDAKQAIENLKNEFKNEYEKLSKYAREKEQEVGRLIKMIENPE